MPVPGRREGWGQGRRCLVLLPRQLALDTHARPAVACPDATAAVLLSKNSAPPWPAVQDQLMLLLLLLLLLQLHRQQERG